MLAAICVAPLLVTAQERTNPDQPFYQKSLHYTNQGLEHWYAKENGGLERITGVPFSQLSSCNRCHVRTCDSCHAGESRGKPAYSAATAKSESACDRCHALESRKFAREHPGDPAADVHFARGMKCMDCHSVREIHGDGTAYVSMQAPGAMDARCENCHKHLAKCTGNAAHGGKVDCNACHVREVASCYNCHMDSRIKEGKSVSLPLNGTTFLINHEGKVTVANLHTFIYQNKTMIVFAPAFPHSIMKKGRQCADCHGTPAVRALQAGTLKAVEWEGAGLKNVRGIIPVLEGFDWRFPFLNYVDGHWVPAEDAAPPVLNYSGYSQPMTREQLARLAKTSQQSSSPR